MAIVGFHGELSRANTVGTVSTMEAYDDVALGRKTGGDGKRGQEKRMEEDERGE